MKKLIAILCLFSMSTISFAGGMGSLAAKTAAKTDTELASLSSTSSDLKFEKLATISMVKTDLYFCFKGAIGATLSGDEVVDKLIMKNCDTRLEEAKNLNISDKEIEDIAKRVLEENKKDEFELSVDRALNLNH